MRGVVATSETLEECRNQLAEVVEEWVLIHVAKRLAVPPLIRPPFASVCIKQRPRT